MNSPALLDLNVLIALAWPSHIHHLPAHQWFAQEQKNGWATCPITQSGFVRLSSNPKVLPEAVSPNEALQLLDQITRLSNHLFWQDSITLSEAIIFQQANIIGYRQVTDAYLLSLALHNKGHLTSFDKGIATLVPDSYRNALRLIEG
ncbi:MAG: TA system VapC family ribonuclease toxin [Methylococcales bacterium]